MFIDFFYLLRQKKVPVSITEWMTLMEALSRGYAQSSLQAFYYLARAILVKSEVHYDQYDQAFQEYFQGIEASEDLVQQALEWMRNPANLRLSPEELAQLRQMHRALEIEGEDDSPDGEDRWIGRGRSSRGRHGEGEGEDGVRTEEEGGRRTAIKVAAERHFKNYRDDITLDVRQFQLALKRLRQLNRQGPVDELALEETIDATSRNAGELELIWRRRRKNAVKLLLLMDVGGSMTPYSRLCSQLFSAAHTATHFKDFKYYYFHNCMYDRIYLDVERKSTYHTSQMFRTLESDYRVILVGDASMGTEELTQRHGAIWYIDKNETPGILWLRRVASHFSHCVWLNPEPLRLWNHPTIRMVRQVFPMYPLTLEGLGLAIKKLVVKL
ncbi:MAG: VWA domain-containing protein [Candidatus Tectomicrobia bacterium]|uniref:VWA domain-containing protein n=1 Tax=Tectimicrobiota bacterium TaxID=2528274 RepID=A0A932CR42_UNCTE|nr:VWA domain-containing protein [Candidatus Tectomicrobia bacterium]